MGSGISLFTATIPTTRKIMMTNKQLVQISLESGKTLLVEAEGEAVQQGGKMAASRLSSLQEKVAKTLDDALETTKEAAESIIEKLSGLKNSPQEIDVEFGIKLTAGLDAIISSTGAEANFKVTLKWKKNVNE
jgi:hypothetical protein